MYLSGASIGTPEVALDRQMILKVEDGTKLSPAKAGEHGSFILDEKVSFMKKIKIRFLLCCFIPCHPNHTPTGLLLLTMLQNTTRDEVYQLPAPSFILQEALGVDFDHPFNWAEVQGNSLLFVQLLIP